MNRQLQVTSNSLARWAHHRGTPHESRAAPLLHSRPRNSNSLLRGTRWYAVALAIRLYRWYHSLAIKLAWLRRAADRLIAESITSMHVRHSLILHGRLFVSQRVIRHPQSCATRQVCQCTTLMVEEHLQHFWGTNVVFTAFNIWFTSRTCSNCV